MENEIIQFFKDGIEAKQWMFVKRIILVNRFGVEVNEVIDSMKNAGILNKNRGLNEDLHSLNIEL
jgi:hypothetical protein